MDSAAHGCRRIAQQAKLRSDSSKANY